MGVKKERPSAAYGFEDAPFYITVPMYISQLLLPFIPCRRSDSITVNTVPSPTLLDTEIEPVCISVIL